MRRGERMRANPYHIKAEVFLQIPQEKEEEEKQNQYNYDGPRWSKELGRLVKVGRCTADVAEI